MPKCKVELLAPAWRDRLSSSVLLSRNHRYMQKRNRIIMSGFFLSAMQKYRYTVDFVTQTRYNKVYAIDYKYTE